MTDKKLAGKIALVTGAASGTGRAVCERFAADGVRVVVADLDQVAWDQVASAIGPVALGVALDVTQQQR